MFGFSEWELEVLGMCLQDSDLEEYDAPTVEDRFRSRLEGEAHPRLSVPEWVFLTGRVLRLGDREMRRLVERLGEEYQS